LAARKPSLFRRRSCHHVHIPRGTSREETGMVTSGGVRRLPHGWEVLSNSDSDEADDQAAAGARDAAAERRERATPLPSGATRQRLRSGGPYQRCGPRRSWWQSCSALRCIPSAMRARSSPSPARDGSVARTGGLSCPGLPCFCARSWRRRRATRWRYGDCFTPADRAVRRPPQRPTAGWRSARTTAVAVPSTARSIGAERPLASQPDLSHDGSPPAASRAGHAS